MAALRDNTSRPALLAILGLGTSVLIIGAILALSSRDPKHSGKQEHADILTFLREHVEARLKDPDSVRYQKLVFFEDSFGKQDPTQTGASYSLCGELNARNSMGGYSGFHRFVATTVVSKEGRPTDESSSVFIESMDYEDKVFPSVAKNICVGEKIALIGLIKPNE